LDLETDDVVETADGVTIGLVLGLVAVTLESKLGIILFKPSKIFFLENNLLGIISPLILMNKNAKTTNKKTKLIFQRVPSHCESFEKVKSSLLTDLLADLDELDELEDLWRDLLKLYEDILFILY
jgi:hypothetical protein